MDLREVASLLGLSRDVAKMAIEEGITTSDGKLIELRAVVLPTGPDVTEADLDAFIRHFELEEPGRHPPVSIRRELLIESGYRCAVCKGDAPLEYHHILGWAAIKHHDAQHMLAVCSNCHAKITRYGQPDSIAQKEIKRRLRNEYAAAVQAIANAAVFAQQMPANVPAQSAITRPASNRSTLSRQTSIAEPSQSQVPVDAAVMRQIFAREVTYQGPTDEELDWIAGRLFCGRWDAQLSRGAVIMLRSLRAITEIQAATNPGLVWTTWTYTERLLEVAANVIAEVDDNPLAGSELAKAALADARRRNLLQFEDVDEWHPGMTSGSGWVERVTLSRIGDKILRKLG